MINWLHSMLWNMIDWLHSKNKRTKTRSVGHPFLYGACRPGLRLSYGFVFRMSKIADQLVWSRHIAAIAGLFSSMSKHCHVHGGVWKHATKATRGRNVQTADSWEDGGSNSSRRRLGDVQRSNVLGAEAWVQNSLSNLQCSANENVCCLSEKT